MTSAAQHIYPHADLTGVRAIFEPERYPKAGTPNADVRLGVVAATGRRHALDGSGRAARTVAGARGLAARIRARSPVQRTNRVQNQLDLLAADAATGAARLVLRETDRAWVNVSDDIGVAQGRAAA